MTYGEFLKHKQFLFLYNKFKLNYELGIVNDNHITVRHFTLNMVDKFIVVSRNNKNHFIGTFEQFIHKVEAKNA